MAAFWSAVLGGPVDDGSSRGFASIGGTCSGRQLPAWYLNRTREPKRAKNRVHLDLVDSDPAAVDRLIGLGAAVVGEHELSPGGHRWTVLLVPEGNEFCLSDRRFTGGA